MTRAPIPARLIGLARVRSLDQLPDDGAERQVAVAAGFIAHTESGTGSGPPRFIEDEFDAGLEASQDRPQGQRRVVRARDNQAGLRRRGRRQRASAAATAGGAGATAASAPDQLPWRAGTECHAARDSSAAGAGAAAAGNASRGRHRMTGRAHPGPSVPDRLVPPARARLRDRHAALPELRRRASRDHRCRLRATGQIAAGEGSATR